MSKEKIKGVILAGGEGTRLRPLTSVIPKPLISIAGKPCIGYVIESLISANIQDIIITTGYLSNKLINGIANNDYHSASILYSFEPSPRGTAGAIKYIENYLDDTFIVASGDVLSKVDFKEIIAFHKKVKSEITIALTQVPDPSEYGIVIIDDEKRIIRFKEKPKKEEQFSNLINTGIYVIEPSVIDLIPKDSPYDFSKQLFPYLLSENHNIFGYEISSSMWRDIGRPSDLLNATFDVLDKEREFVLGENAIIEENVTTNRPLYIGKGALVKARSKISKSALYDNVIVESDSIINSSILFSNVKVGNNSKVESSIIANDSVIEEGCTIMNSVIGFGITIKKGSKIENARISL
ncbi:MAG: sugar phosphate nucleotidyltransferase [Thermoplasmata archaeon]